MPPMHTHPEQQERTRTAQHAQTARPARATPSWSRTGCVTCKRRRKKCDQGRPACVNCCRRGIPCEGYQQPFVAQIIRGCPTPSVSSAPSSSSSSTRQKRKPSPAAEPHPARTTEAELDTHSGTPFGTFADFSFYRAILSPGQTPWQSLLLSPLPLPRLESPVAESATQGDGAERDSSADDALSTRPSPNTSVASPTPAVPAVYGMSPSENNTPEHRTPHSADNDTHHSVEGAENTETTQTTDTTRDGIIEEEVAAPAVSHDDTVPEIINDNNAVHITSHNVADAAIYNTNVFSSIADINTECLHLEAEAHLPGTILSPSSEPNLLPTFPQFSEQDVYYIQYLYEQGARQLLNMDAGPQNPLRCLFLPRALQSTGVLHAMCAVSACHRARQADPDTRLTFSMAAARFYSKATTWLRTSLQECVSRMGRLELDDTSLFTAILLCKYEIIHGSVRHWNGHLRGLENMFRSCGGMEALGVDCRQYIRSFIRYHRTVGSITNASVWMQAEDDGTDEALEGETSAGFSIDPYSGCSYYLLYACRSISKLAGRVEQKSLTSFPDFSSHVQKIITSLGTSNIQLGEQPCPPGVTMAQIGRLLFVAQRIRYAAFVFLHAMIEYAENTLVDVSAADWRSLVDSLPYTKVRAVDGCLDMLETLPVGAHCEFAALTLPLFIAGCETEDPKQRYFVLDRLFLLEKSVAIGNIARARDALMMIWQHSNEAKQPAGLKGKTDRHFWWKVLQEMGWELILS